MLEKGLVIAFVGMGGTLFTLWILTLIIEGLKRVFPYRDEETNGKEIS
ncbi:MAG: OadG-related small transporter subunit [Thermodesulforhabdaceae bacterium]|jgi:Na+-transporting methylmalonyl-CoA/oxaloacetate decarboxylase gamma subunit